MDIQAGDRVTYEISNGVGGKIRRMTIITEDNEAFTNDTEIIKIERPKYEVLEEKKELLTEQEKEFLKLYMQFTNIITNTIYKKDGFINFIGYTVELALYKGFDKLVENKLYTLKELGLEEN